MINGEQESLLDTIKGLVDSYNNNDTEAIKDEFTVAVNLERSLSYAIARSSHSNSYPCQREL